MDIRSATLDDCDALGLITVSASLRAFIGHVPEESLDLGWRPQDSAAGWRTTMQALRGDEFMCVAEVDDSVVGFVWAGMAQTERTGEVKGLYVRPTRQHEGIGRLLLAHAVDQLEQRAAIESLLVGCIGVNPSCGFYRHLGGVEAFRRPNAVDRFPTEEIFFSWSDLSQLRSGGAASS